MSFKRILLGCVCSFIGAFAGMFISTSIIRMIEPDYVSRAQVSEEFLSTNTKVTLVLISMFVGIVVTPIICAKLYHRFIACHQPNSNCEKCEYNLIANQSGSCPECGAMISQEKLEYLKRIESKNA